MSSTRMWRTALRFVPVLCGAYVLSQFLRSSNAVIAPDLMRDMGLGPEALGGLTGLFFLTFALAQIPVGILLDNIGPRLTMTALLGFAIAGSMLFGLSHGIAGLFIGRAFMGIGCAALFIGGLVVYARWLPPERFAAMVSIEMGVGYSGIVLATAPLAWAAASLGWRSVFLGVALYAGLLVVAILALVRDAPPGHAFAIRRRESMVGTARGFSEVLRNPRLPPILPMLFVGYASMFSVLGLWAGPYLHDVHGLGIVERGNVMLVIAVSAVAGLFAYGPLDGWFNTRKWLVVFGATGSTGIFCYLALAQDIGLATVTVVLSALAALNGYSVVLIAHGRSIYADRLVGRGMTTNNIANMGGVAVLPSVTGYIIGAFPTTAGVAPEVAYRSVFGFLAVLLMVALAIYLRAEDVRPRPAPPPPAGGHHD